MRAGLRPGHVRLDRRFLQVHAGPRLRADPARRRRRGRARARPSLGGLRAASPPLLDPGRARDRARLRRDPVHRPAGSSRRRVRPARGFPLGHRRLGPSDEVRQGLPLAARPGSRHCAGSVLRRPVSERLVRLARSRPGASPAADDRGGRSRTHERDDRADRRRRARRGGVGVGRGARLPGPRPPAGGSGSLAAGIPGGSGLLDPGRRPRWSR